MSRLTRDGTAEPVSRDQIPRRTYGDRRISIFPVQLTTSRIGNLTRLIHTHDICDNPTYTHKNIQKSTYTHQIVDPPQRQNKLIKRLNSSRIVGGSRTHRMLTLSLRCPQADIQKEHDSLKCLPGKQALSKETCCTRSFDTQITLKCYSAYLAINRLTIPIWGFSDT